MSGSISFSTIPPNIRVPLFYAEFSTTNAGVSQPVQRTLIIGGTPNAAPATPTYVPSPAWAQGAYGAGSQLALMIAAYRANDPVGEIWALPVSDNVAGAAATGSLTITGTATANGTLQLYLAGAYVPVAVASGNTAAQVASAIAAAIGAMPTLPLTASAAAGVVTLTAREKGTLGNAMPLVLNYLGAQGGQTTPPGLAVAIGAMAGGATDASLASIVTWLGNLGFDFVVNPYANATALGYTTALMSDSAGRWSYSNAVYGHVFTADQDTAANLIAFGAAQNDQHLTVLGVNTASPTPPWIWAAAFVGAIAPALKADPARPVQTLPIAGVLPPPSASDFTFTQQQSLLTAGIAVAARVPGGGTAMVRAVTTYQLNSQGVADASYLDTETLFTLMAFVRSMKATITQKFPRAKLAADGTRFGAGQPIVTPAIARGVLIAAYAAFELQGLVQNTAAFGAGLICAINANDPTRLDVLLDPILVSGLRIFAALTEFTLQAPATAAVAA